MMDNSQRIVRQFHVGTRKATPGTTNREQIAIRHCVKPEHAAQGRVDLVRQLVPVLPGELTEPERAEGRRLETAGLVIPDIHQLKATAAKIADNAVRIRERADHPKRGEPGFLVA